MRQITKIFDLSKIKCKIIEVKKGNIIFEITTTKNFSNNLLNIIERWNFAINEEKNKACLEFFPDDKNLAMIKNIIREVKISENYEKNMDSYFNEIRKIMDQKC